MLVVSSLCPVFLFTSPSIW